MIPTPPVLVPPEGWTTSCLDTDVTGNPLRVLGIQGTGEKLQSLSRAKEQFYEWAIPAQQMQVIVRTTACGLIFVPDHRFDQTIGL